MLGPSTHTPKLITCSFPRNTPASCMKMLVMYTEEVIRYNFYINDGKVSEISAILHVICCEILIDGEITSQLGTGAQMFGFIIILIQILTLTQNLSPFRILSVITQRTGHGIWGGGVSAQITGVLVSMNQYDPNTSSLFT